MYCKTFFSAQPLVVGASIEQVIHEGVVSLIEPREHYITLTTFRKRLLDELVEDLSVDFDSGFHFREGLPEDLTQGLLRLAERHVLLDVQRC